MVPPTYHRIPNGSAKESRPPQEAERAFWENPQEAHLSCGSLHARKEAPSALLTWGLTPYHLLYFPERKEAIRWLKRHAPEGTVVTVHCGPVGHCWRVRIGGFPILEERCGFLFSVPAPFTFLPFAFRGQHVRSVSKASLCLQWPTVPGLYRWEGEIRQDRDGKPIFRGEIRPATLADLEAYGVPLLPPKNLPLPQGAGGSFVDDVLGWGRGSR